jgi:hypothetical protein
MATAARQRSTAPAPPEQGLASLAEEAGVTKGLGAFATPPAMQVDRWASLAISVAPDAPTLQSEMPGRMSDAPKSIFVARLMRVTLNPNPAFEIRASNAAEQDTGLDGAATWLWEVRPKEGGTYELTATVEVLGVKPNGRRVTLDTYARPVTLTVKVGSVQRAVGAIDDATKIGDSVTGMFGSWGKAAAAFGALLAALGTLAWRLGLRKKKPEA